MKKLLMMLMAMIYSHVTLANQIGSSDEYSTPKTIGYIVIAIILVTVIAAVLYKSPKRKFNE